MKFIICIGNRYLPADAVGIRVHDYLSKRVLPEGMKLIEGGLAGLNLLRFMDGAERVVFVDRIIGIGKPGDIRVLTSAEVSSFIESRYDHSSGLAYMLRLMPEVCDGVPPEIWLVGIEGLGTEREVNAAAAVALRIASHGWNANSHLSLNLDPEFWNENWN